MPTIISQSMLSDYGSLTTKHTSRAAHICTEASLGIFRNKTCHCQRHRGRLADVGGAARSQSWFLQPERHCSAQVCVVARVTRICFSRWVTSSAIFLMHMLLKDLCQCCSWNQAFIVYTLHKGRYWPSLQRAKSHLITLFLRIKYRSCGDFWSINRKISAWLERNSATEARRQWSLFRAKVWK